LLAFPYYFFTNKNHTVIKRILLTTAAKRYVFTIFHSIIFYLLVIRYSESVINTIVIINDMPNGKKKSSMFFGRAKSGAITPAEN